MLSGDVPLDMTYIPAGEFWMGAPEDEEASGKAERPQHRVKVPQFFLGKYPITQAQYLVVMGKNPSNFTEDFKDGEKTINALQRPVERVSWDNAQEFCSKLREITGKPYRLPTEAEWEYACRGVVPEGKGEALTQEIWNEKYHQPFHFGKIISDKVANYRATEVYGRGVNGEFRQQTSLVGYFDVANGFGLYDMHGNVWEWCEDAWSDDYSEASPQGDTAFEDKSTNFRIRRGGTWIDAPRFCRSAYRVWSYRDFQNSSYGFRVAVSPQ